MRHAQNAVFVHLIWATWDRAPLLIGAVQRNIYRSLEAKCSELGVEVLALGGIEDHVHLLVRLPTTLVVADLVKHLKGTSAHLIAQRLHPDQSFKWQGAYAAFSVSMSHLDRVARYIAGPREHHAMGSLIAAWELPPPVLPAASSADGEKPAQAGFVAERTLGPKGAVLTARVPYPHSKYSNETCMSAATAASAADLG
jgi:REP-associated tyrosine transposase